MIWLNERYGVLHWNIALCTLNTVNIMKCPFEGGRNWVSQCSELCLIIRMKNSIVYRGALFSGTTINLALAATSRAATFSFSHRVGILAVFSGARALVSWHTFQPEHLVACLFGFTTWSIEMLYVQDRPNFMFLVGSVLTMYTMEKWTTHPLSFFLWN